MKTPRSSTERFSKLEDPRVDRSKKQARIDIIVLRVCAVVGGTEGWSDIEEIGHAKPQWLRRYVPLVNGIAAERAARTCRTRRRHPG